MYDGFGWGWAAMMFMPLLWIVLLGAVIWAVVRLAQPSGGAGPARPAPSGRESALEILDRRLASGEIDTETYREVRDQLTGREVGPG